MTRTQPVSERYGDLSTVTHLLPHEWVEQLARLVTFDRDVSWQSL